MYFEKILEKLFTWIKKDGLKLLLAVIILFIVFKTINIITRKAEKRIRNKKKKIDETIIRIGISVTRKSLKFISFVCFLSYVGIETTSIAAAIASTGLGIGLALQGSLSNFAGGVIILIMRPYKIGDYVECNGSSGTVEDIKMFYTYITTIDNKVIMIPNGKIADSSITNYSSKKYRRLDIIFSIDSSNDIDNAKKAIQESIRMSQYSLNNPMPSINLEGYEDNRVQIILKVWCENNKYWDLFYYFQEDIKRQFNKNGVIIPYSHVDVHIRNHDFK